MNKCSTPIGLALAAMMACCAVAGGQPTDSNGRSSAARPAEPQTAPQAAPRPAPKPAARADWSDRRAVGVVMLAANEFRTPQNPRGWFGDFIGYGAEFVDVNDRNYKRRFADRLLAHGDRCVRWARMQDCQGVVIWDLEGEEFNHPVTYVGDPRILPPEMTVETAASFSRKFTDAGIRVGGTIRPQVLLQTPYGPKQFRTGDAEVVLTEKVNYARRVLGWRLFYVDSNTTADSFVDGKPHPLPVEIFKNLSDTFPDCLFITEFTGPGYADVPALLPWRSYAEGSADVPPGPGGLAIRPGTDLDSPENRPKLLAGFRAGCIPVVPTDRAAAQQWWPKVKGLYEEATAEKRTPGRAAPSR